jgi:crotonobetainyl-CoA:carnitine CoA-transferase CaiB-like acyl-CoA transferase
MVAEVASPEGGTVRTLGSPVMLDRQAHTSQRPAPRIGEHTAQALAAFGFGGDEIQALLAAGAVYQNDTQPMQAGVAAA